MPSDESDSIRAVREAGERVGLTLSERHLPGVAQHLGLLAAQATAVMEFPLEESDDPAPVFTP